MPSLTRTILAGTLVVSLFGSAAVAQTRAPADEQIARLGADLTSVGAERAGNATGSIPAYQGGLPKSVADASAGYADPFASDQPLYTITARNVDEHRGLLSNGHLALFKRDPLSFKMLVYPARRSAALPPEVLAEIRKQAPLARTDGDHVLDVGRTAVPFPLPADGLQVMWNHVFRWRGGSVDRRITLSPVSGNGTFYVAKLRQSAVFDQQGLMEEPLSGRLYASETFFYSPPSATGTRTITWEPVDPVAKGRARWVYIPQTLDTRRLPSYDHDTLEPFTGGLRTADQTDGWNGDPSRYDWKLLGKRELLIGYNAYRLADRSLPYAAILRPHHPNPELLRYELHRVWVVEATLRPGSHHRYHRRVFFVDEDTWQVAQQEIYTEKGALFRFDDNQMMQFYDVMVPWYAATIHHDLKSGGYLVAGLSNEEPGPWRWGFEGRNADFFPSNLRSFGMR